MSSVCQTAFADVVAYQNSSPMLVWLAQGNSFSCPGSLLNSNLDVTLPSTQDADLPTPSSIYYDNCFPGGGSFTCGENYYHPSIPGAVSFARSPKPIATVQCESGKTE
ncbi:MAG: hypothetical protein H7210_13960, partial [Pyrinomonadaceae bacterium]|nr:hypothetical protein [Phycisphaerales bacterium]